MQNSELREAFSKFIRADSFPCIGAKAALAHQKMVFLVANAIDRDDSDYEIHAALRDFGAGYEPEDSALKSLAVIFRGPTDLSEKSFEDCLWDRLQRLHDLDVAQGEEWTTQSDADTQSARFSMSVAGNAFFIVGLHPHAARPGRRFNYPVMVFNSHLQFERLRQEGRFQRFQSVIRKRDAALAGHVNPMLSDYGDASEACQYSGRKVGQDWRAPLEIREPKQHG